MGQQYAPVAPVASVAYAPVTAPHTVILAPPVQADYVVMNGKTYASMEEAMQDYCNVANAANAPVEESAPVVESAPPPVEEAQDAAEPAAEKTVRAVKPTKKGCC